MKVGIPKEILPGETRVAVIPDTVKRLTEQGLEVLLESGAGLASGCIDEAYREAGAKIQASADQLYAEAELILKIQPPALGEDGLPDEVAALPKGRALITMLQPFAKPGRLQRLAAANITALSMEFIPRISRAQNMDALSSMATVAGYKAVLLAANHFPRFFPMFMTAAGTIAPARTLVLGVGVAGLQAIATAKRLGALVEASDIRPEVEEQVKSLGARFVGLDMSGVETQDEGGYAKELAEDLQQRLLEAISKRLPRTDIIIATAQIPGRPAPVLVSEQMVKQLKPGSIIVDLAIESGGNCALSEYDQTVERHGVTIMAPVNLPALMPVHASQMYSRNMGNVVSHLVRDGQLQLDEDDPIAQGMMVTHAGAIVHPRLKTP